MKRCSQCNRTYQDDNLKICLSDGTLLVSGFDALENASVIKPLPYVEQPARNSLLAYSAVIALVLLVSTLLFIWIKSDSSTSSNSKNEVSNAISNTEELIPNKGQELLSEQNTSLQEKQVLLEKVKLKPTGIKIGLIDNSSGHTPGCGGCSYWKVGKKPKLIDPTTQKYILLADTDDNAWMNINNEIVNLRLVNYTYYEKKRERFIKTYQAGDITVEVECKITGHGDMDAVDCDATLTVVKDTEKQSVKAIGNCSC